MKYVLFGNTGLRVSEMALGTMTFGNEWGWGAEKEESYRIFETYVQWGGNFIDTANRYTEGNSEKILGELIKNDRDHFVLGTKYSLHDRLGDPNFSGNHRKNLMRSVRESLKRLQTDFIDILWVHAWDFYTPVEEVLRGLQDLISMGTVHYIAISDTPAWVVAQANTIAQMRGWVGFSAIQAEYNLLQRHAERDLLPMAQAFGLSMTAWAPLAGGALTGKYLNGQKGRLAENSARRNERNSEIARKVVEVAQKLEISASQVALLWNMRFKNVIPIVGSRNAAQLAECLAATNYRLESKDLDELNLVSDFEKGFPHDFLNSDAVKQVVYGGTFDQMRSSK